MGEEQGVKKRLAELTAKLIGAPYKLGGHNAKEGFDCYSLFLAACDYWGAHIPDAFDGLTLENYAERFRQDPDGTKKILFRFLGTIGQEIRPSRAFAGDLLVTTVKGSDIPGIGIHAGNDGILAAYRERGVAVMPLRAYNIIKAYRVI